MKLQVMVYLILFFCALKQGWAQSSIWRGNGFTSLSRGECKESNSLSLGYVDFKGVKQGEVYVNDLKGKVLLSAGALVLKVNEGPHTYKVLSQPQSGQEALVGTSVLLPGNAVHSLKGQSIKTTNANWNKGNSLLKYVGLQSCCRDGVCSKYIDVKKGGGSHLLPLIPARHFAGKMQVPMNVSAERPAFFSDGLVLTKLGKKTILQLLNFKTDQKEVSFEKASLKVLRREVKVASKVVPAGALLVEGSRGFQVKTLPASYQNREELMKVGAFVSLQQSDVLPIKGLSFQLFLFGKERSYTFETDKNKLVYYVNGSGKVFYNLIDEDEPDLSFFVSVFSLGLLEGMEAALDEELPLTKELAEASTLGLPPTLKPKRPVSYGVPPEVVDDQDKTGFVIEPSFSNSFALEQRGRSDSSSSGWLSDWANNNLAKDPPSYQLQGVPVYKQGVGYYVCAFSFIWGYKDKGLTQRERVLRGNQVQVLQGSAHKPFTINKGENDERKMIHVLYKGKKYWVASRYITSYAGCPKIRLEPREVCVNNYLSMYKEGQDLSKDAPFGRLGPKDVVYQVVKHDPKERKVMRNGVQVTFIPIKTDIGSKQIFWVSKPYVVKRCTKNDEKKVTFQGRYKKCTVREKDNFPLASRPKVSYVTDRIAKFGARRDGGKRKHAATDLYTQPRGYRGNWGKEVYAIDDGQVNEVHGYGGEVGMAWRVLVHSKYGYTWNYAELKKVKVKSGQYIKKGTLIGTAYRYAKGRSYPPMAHMEKFKTYIEGPKEGRVDSKYKRNVNLEDPTCHMQYMERQKFGAGY